MSLVLALDVGSSNLKVGLLDARGRFLVQREAPVRRLYPERGACEHDPEEILSTLRRLSRSVCRSAPSPVKALCISAYNLSVLCVDKELRPLGGVITLLDTRSEKSLGALKRSCDSDKLYRLTGSPIFAQTPLARIYWLRHERPSQFNRTAYFLSLKDYLVARLSGKLCAELSTASASQLLNIHRLKWEPYALKLAGIRSSQLAPLVEGHHSLGALPLAVSSAWGLAPGAILVPGFYDGAAAALGLGALEKEGMGVVNLGTTAMLRVIARKPVLDSAGSKGFQAYYICDGNWFVGSGINNAGSALQWLSKDFLNAPLPVLEKEAAKIAPGSEGVIFMPHFSPERSPLYGDSASASICGLTRGSGRAQVTRALLEGLSFMMHQLAQAMSRRGLGIRELRLAGGGTKSTLWRKILSAVMGSPSRLNLSSEQAGLLGNAMLAQVALGTYRNLAQASRQMLHLPSPQNASGSFKRAYEKPYAAFLDAQRIL